MKRLLFLSLLFFVSCDKIDHLKNKLQKKVKEVTSEKLNVKRKANSFKKFKNGVVGQDGVVGGNYTELLLPDGKLRQSCHAWLKEHFKDDQTKVTTNKSKRMSKCLYRSEVSNECYELERNTYANFLKPVARCGEKISFYEKGPHYPFRKRWIPLKYLKGAKNKDQAHGPWGKSCNEWLAQEGILVSEMRLKVNFSADEKRTHHCLYETKEKQCLVMDRNIKIEGEDASKIRATSHCKMNNKAYEVEMLAGGGNLPPKPLREMIDFEKKSGQSCEEIINARGLNINEFEFLVFDQSGIQKNKCLLSNDQSDCVIADFSEKREGYFPVGHCSIQGVKLKSLSQAPVYAFHRFKSVARGPVGVTFNDWVLGFNKDKGYLSRLRTMVEGKIQEGDKRIYTYKDLRGSDCVILKGNELPTGNEARPQMNCRNRKGLSYLTIMELPLLPTDNDLPEYY